MTDITFEQLKEICKCFRRVKIEKDKIIYRQYGGCVYTIDKNNNEHRKVGHDYDIKSSFLEFASRIFFDNDTDGTFKDWNTLKKLLNEYRVDYDDYKWRIK